MAPEARAQTPPPRSIYIFHVYVDPLFGDDALALASNPGVSGNPAPLSFHPSAIQNGIGGLLQQAPLAFRTLTSGVRPYLDQLHSTYGGGQLPLHVDALGNGNVQTFLTVNGVPTAPPDENVDPQDVTPVPHQPPVESATQRLGRRQ